MTQKQSIQTALDKQSKEVKSEYQVRLNASIEVIKQLLKGALSFRGHDKSESSIRRCHFSDLFEWHTESNENVRSILKRPPLNNKLTSPDIQKDITHSCAKETIGKILEELRDGYFAVLVDESRDVSCKRQMAFFL